MKITAIFSKKPFKNADVCAVGYFEGERPLPKELAAKKFDGKCGSELLLSSRNASAGFTLAIGLGRRDKFTLERIRRAAAKLVSQGQRLKAQTLGMDLDSFRGKFSASQIASAAVEGARLSDYRFNRYKSKPGSSHEIASLVLFSDSGASSASVRSAVREAEIVSEAVCFTRDLANEPANVMTPRRLSAAAREMARKNGLSCRVLGLREIKNLKMGGMIGVSQGSAEEPQFIILENRPARPRFKDPIVLVGKGITFDTGGISIKPSNDMDKMKFDMCGAAAVIGAMKAIANLKLSVKVVGLTPVCENMPGSRAQRPGDIITCLNGKTVEVLNTDAEGRLILADALEYAKKFKPKALVDAATLTGACAATFADLAIGLMGTDPELVGRIKEAGEQTGERCWELPLWDEYRPLIKATYADIQNISKKYAGTITAGMFLKEFADHTKTWAHLDIAGTAWNEGAPKLLSPIGATGVGVRLFVQLVKSYLE